MMLPEWFDIDNIPFDQMFEDDRIWYPILVAGKKFKGQAVFGDDYKILSQTIKEVDSL